MQCPLPIDWLEYIEGTKSEELACHLQECVPCQLLIDELRQHSRAELDSSKYPKSESWPRWKESRPPFPRFGEIWWTSDSLKTRDLAIVRLLVAIVSEAWEERGKSWCDVVPLMSDIENATSLDLVLSRESNTLRVPWRMLLRYQTVMEVNDLGFRVGSMTSEGATVIQQALKGQSKCDWFGSQIENSNDPRLYLAEDLIDAIKVLGEKYAYALEENEITKPSKEILMFPMHCSRRSIPSAQRELSLAAASTPTHETNYWSVHIPKRGSIEGRIFHRYQEDELLFVVDALDEEQIGWKTTVWIVVWFVGEKEPTTSQPFEPFLRKEVLLSRDLGIFPNEINRLELKVVNEG